MKDIDLVGEWRKSGTSQSASDCVEVARLADDGTAIRDTKDRAGPMLALSAGAWRAFLTSAKTGTFI